MIVVDDKSLQAALKATKLDANDMLQIEGAGARVQMNGQRARVAVDTGATRASVSQHIEESSETRVVDEIGPETVYGPNIEWGRQDMPNYPIQPFVRPTAEEDEPQTINAIANAFGATVIERWPK